MKIESILGITASLIAIGTIVYQGYKKFQTKDLDTLFTELADPNTPIKKQHRILHKISQDARLNGNSISKSYIRNFSSDRRSKSAIFHDICKKNHIEPTKDLCSGVLGYDEPSFYKEWVQYHKQDTVYMSALLKERHQATYERLIAILDKHGIPYALLEGTRDIWCRDYMPVQTSGGKLVQFRYDPSYLNGKPEWRASKSDVKEVCAANKLHPVFSDINLDGGNVVMYGKKAIITDRVFSENPKIDERDLRKQLSDLLEAEIVIIPAYAKSIDFTGHADGMIRFVDAETVIGLDNEQESRQWKDKMDEAMRVAKLNYVKFPFFDCKIKGNSVHAIGVYLNYLEIGNLIVMPVFGDSYPGNKDAEALAKMKELFPHKTIETIDYNDVALEGGLLNCTTWVARQ